MYPIFIRYPRLRTSEKGLNSSDGLGFGGVAPLWSNYPRRCTDGRMLPRVRGLITTQDGASILSRNGRTLSAGSSPITKATVG
jgi:hypothetical protein